MVHSLADYLRTLPDEDLVALVRLRPDLVVPVPADLSTLAARAQSRVSLARSLDGLDRFTLQVLDGIRLVRTDDTARLPDVLALTRPGATLPGHTRTIEARHGRASADADRVRAAVEALRARCLVYGPDSALVVMPAMDELCSRYPAGLGRPAADLSEQAATLASDPAGLRRTLLSAPTAARAVLDRLATDQPLGTVSPASLAPGSPSPVRWLVDADLLVPIGEDSVELPREVGLLLRREVGPLGRLEADPPPLKVTQREPAAVDSAGAGQAMEAVRLTEMLLEALAAEPATILRSGGLGVRDLRRLARAADTTEPTAALLLETAWAAGLLGETASDSSDAQYLPTVGYDSWHTRSIATRWVCLAEAWLRMARSPEFVGQRDDRDRPVNALSADTERMGAPARRLAALSVLAGAPAGGAAGSDAVLEVLQWRIPRRAGRWGTTGVDAVLAEAASLGLVSLGALTGYGRLLLPETTPLAGPTGAPEMPGRPEAVGRTGGTRPASGVRPVGAARPTGATAPSGTARVLDGPGRDASPPGFAGEDVLGVRSDEPPRILAAVEALDALLPAPVDHVVLQTDLTVVVPGPPDPVLATELAVVADAESPSVYRITTESIRRALDLGYAAPELHQLFAHRSRTPVPQALTYLVDDVSRRHGGLRAGSASSYLRSDDESLVAEVAADRRLTTLSLRRLAPTVLTSPYPVSRLLQLLRGAGYVPVAEDSSGSTVLTRPKQRRAPARTLPAPQQIDDPLVMPELPAPRIAGIVEQLRRREAATRAIRRAPGNVRSPGGGVVAHTRALAVLQQALREEVRVWVGYVDAHGTPTSRLVRPVSMGGGYLRAEDERTETLHTFALHRITAAAFEEGPGAS